MHAPGATDRPLRILHTIHDFLPRHRAGSEIYVAQLCRELALRHHVTVVCADYDPARAHGQLTWRLHEGLPVVEIANNWVCSSFGDTYRSPLVSRRLEELLRIVQPHVVHVHNLLNLSLDLPSAARSQGIPVVATLHDYTLVCPSGGQRLHRAESHICRTIDTARCARCFVQSPFYTQASVGPVAGAMAASGFLRRAVSSARRRLPGLAGVAARTFASARRFPVTTSDIAVRLEAARGVFDQINLFVAPSRSIADEFVALGLDPSKVHVRDNGFAELAPAVRTRPDGRLRIGFVGTLVWHKGPHVLLDAIRQLAGAYEVQLHGDLSTWPDYAADLRRRAQGLPVRFLGGFDDAQRAAVYADLDVLVVPSLWLENSPCVIHEAFQAGVPVIGARIGGIAELIADGRNGRLYDPQSPGELSAMLQSVIDDPGQLATWAAHLPRVKSIADDAREWEQVYARLAAQAYEPAVMFR